MPGQRTSAILGRGGLLGIVLLVSLMACDRDTYPELRPVRVLDVGLPHNAGSADSFAVLVGAGDIARCGSPGASLTARLIDSVLGATSAESWVFTLGDNVYDRGTPEEFLECYDPHWGRFRSVTRPVSGNHEWKHGQLFRVLPILGNADPYFAYFSAFPGQTGTAEEPWYRYRHGAWDVFALDPANRRGIERGDALWRWLEAQLTVPDLTDCVLAYSHYPRFSVGTHGDNPRMRDVWQLMDDRGVDVFVAGHDHRYERFQPQTADGLADSTGIRQFVVGTGGGVLRVRDQPTTGVVATWMAGHHGVIKLTLHAASYTWEFITPEGVRDSGSSACQNPGS